LCNDLFCRQVSSKKSYRLELLLVRDSHDDNFLSASICNFNEKANKQKTLLVVVVGVVIIARNEAELCLASGSYQASFCLSCFYADISASSPGREKK